MSQLALCEVRGLFTDLLEKLSGEEGDQWLIAIKKTLRKENPWPKLKIVPVPFNPVSLIGKDWKEIIEEQDERSASLKEVDFAQVKCVSCLRGNEKGISGKEILRRLKVTENIRLGATVFMALWEDYKANGKDCVLEHAYREKIIGRFIYFFGSILLGPNGHCCVLSLYRIDAGSWDWRVNWLRLGWSVGSLSAVLSQV